MQGTLLVNLTVVLEHTLERRNVWVKSVQKLSQMLLNKQIFFQSPKRSPALSMLVNLIKDEKKEVSVAMLRDRAKQ